MLVFIGGGLLGGVLLACVILYCANKNELFSLHAVSASWKINGKLLPAGLFICLFGLFRGEGSVSGLTGLLFGIFMIVGLIGSLVPLIHDVDDLTERNPRQLRLFEQ